MLHPDDLHLKDDLFPEEVRERMQEFDMGMKVSQGLIDAINKAESDAAAASTADVTATASAVQASTDQKAAQDAHAQATASYTAALAAFYQEFGVTPP